MNVNDRNPFLAAEGAKQNTRTEKKDEKVFNFETGNFSLDTVDKVVLNDVKGVKLEDVNPDSVPSFRTFG